MSKATALEEIPALAEKHGFKRTTSDLQEGRVGYLHAGRAEAFILTTGEDGFEFASWHGSRQYATIVDRREAGSRGADGNHLTANAKRRPLGVGDVRAKMLRSPVGMSVGYLDLKRRIKDADWLEKLT